MCVCMRITAHAYVFANPPSAFNCLLWNSELWNRVNLRCIHWRKIKKRKVHTHMYAHLYSNACVNNKERRYAIGVYMKYQGSYIKIFNWYSIYLIFTVKWIASISAAQLTLQNIWIYVKKQKCIWVCKYVLQTYINNQIIIFWLTI